MRRTGAIFACCFVTGHRTCLPSIRDRSISRRLPFVNVARLLSAMPVPVPRILDHSCELGIIALEDLGDVTLQAHLGTASAAEHAALYREAVTLITSIQHRGRELESSQYLPYSVAFDVEKLMWELRFFTKHFLEAYRGATLSDATREALSDEYAAIAGELAAEPRCSATATITAGT